MQNIDETELITIEGGEVDYWDAGCGVAIGATVAATALFGFVGFALTWGKAVALCTVAATT